MKTLKLTKKDIYKGNLILVNDIYPFLQTESIDLLPVASIEDNLLMERNAASVLACILRELDCNDAITAVSGYRSGGEQAEIYKSSIKENGVNFTKKYVARVGHSEHQTGLAIDLGLKKESIDFICPDFPSDGICGSFKKAAPQYGFIERYPSGKESITGIAHEPWHFRFVGCPHSEIIAKQGLSLEEYVENIRKYTDKNVRFKALRGKRPVEIFYSALDGDAQLELEIPDNCICQASGDNISGFIITLWESGEVGEAEKWGNRA